MAQDRTVFREFMRIKSQDAVLVYSPRIATRKPRRPFAWFVRPRARSSTSRSAIFYRSRPDGLFARVEGTKHGAGRHEDVPRQHVAWSAS